VSEAAESARTTPVNAILAKNCLEYGARRMRLHPPHIAAAESVTKMERLGRVPGR
jgi:hypothetical protein